MTDYSAFDRPGMKPPAAGVYYTGQLLIRYHNIAPPRIAHKKFPVHHHLLERLNVTVMLDKVMGNMRR
jgi:hypothetical protein